MSDIFCGKASVQTAIYVFDVGRPHNTESPVKFIDFSEDGYSRQNRKKSSQSTNLKDTNNAKERYEEIVKLVLYGRGVNDKNLNYYKNSYIEDYISLDGDDWTYGKHQKVDTKPTLDDFKKTVADYLAWEVSNLLKNQANSFGEENSLGK